MRNEAGVVSKRWGKKEPVRDSIGFYTSPILRPYFIETAYGKNFVNAHRNNAYWAEDLFIETYLKNGNCRSILSLCCGFGSIERRFLSTLGTVESCKGLDISEGALCVAKDRIKEEKLTKVIYEYADLNTYEWEENKYDLVIANGALHHLKSLEKVFEGIKRTLRPGGLLYAYEYVGPSYQDHGIRQLELINACSYLVLPELRAKRPLPINITNDLLFKVFSTAVMISNMSVIPPEWSNKKKWAAKALQAMIGEKKRKFRFGVVHRSKKKYLLRVDPSECVRSAEIIPLGKKYLHNLEIRPLGGGVLHHGLDANFYLNFDDSNPQHQKCLELLCSTERQLMENGEIGLDSAFLIWRK